MFDFLVVGGGVVGLSLAWELARRKQRVCVLDRQQMGRATSWVGAGILPPPRIKAKHDAMEQLRVTSHLLHQEWSARLLAETGIDNQLLKCGGVYLARRAGESVALQVEMQQASEDGVRCETLSRSDLIARESRLQSIAEHVRAAYYLPDEMQLRSPLHLRALVAACEREGVELRPELEANSLQLKSNRVAGVATSQGLLQADNYCLCCGPWAAHLLEPLDIRLPVEPWRGQLILWKASEPMLSHVVNEGLRYLVPRADGSLLAGATVEDVGFDCSTTDDATRELMDYTVQLLPELANRRPEHSWAALRPKTPDGHPFMGRIPGISNLSVCSGHFRSGLHLSPASAVFMTQLLLDDVALVEPSPFRIQR